MSRGDIRNWQAFTDGRCNWSWLAAAFEGTAITPSDVDFIVERRGHFLVGEVKPSRSAITRGQDILMQQIAKQPKTTAFYLVGEIANHEIMPLEMLVLGENQWKPTNRSAFFEFCAAWFHKANRVMPLEVP